MEIQPFEFCLTVKIYSPGKLTSGELVFAPEIIPGPVQENETRTGFNGFPINLTVGFRQSIKVSLPANAPGGLDEDVTTALSEIKQPEVGLVIVIEYVPNAATTGVNVFPPDIILEPLHKTVFKGFELMPDNVILVEEQVITLSGPALPTGFIVSMLTLVISVLAQPFEIKVIFKVYIPVLFTVGVSEFAFEIIPGPVQEYVTSLLMLLPFRIGVGVKQVIVLSIPASMSGILTSFVTIRESMLLHPVLVCVTV
jgi:hypothetical protein